MAKKKSKQARRAEKWAKQRSLQGISWKTVVAIFASITTLVGAIVNGLDFINYLREGYQQFLWLGFAVLGLIWLIVLWLLFKQRNIYGILWFIVTVLAGVIIWNGWSSYIQTREEKLIVLITKFEGPEEVFGLRNEILEKLNADFANDIDVEIESVNEVITPNSDSRSPRARELGKKLQADVVIWGWYRQTENPNITIHIENLSPSQIETLQQSEIYQPQATLDQLESFEIQKQLGSETSTLVSYLTGILRFKSGDYQIAIDRLENILIEIGVSTFINPYDIYYTLGDSYLVIREYENAIQNYIKAIEINPQSAKIYTNLGTAYNDLGEYEYAIQFFDSALEIDPQSVVAYNNRGFSYGNLGDFERAIQDFGRAIEIDPNAPTAVMSYSSRGVYYLSISEYKQAIQDFDKIIEFFPQFPHAYVNRGKAYFELGQFELAVQDYKEAIKINPQNGQAYFYRGLVYVSLDKYDLAIQDFSKAIEINPQNEAAYYNRGIIYLDELKQYRLALQDLDKAIEINSQDSASYTIRGIIYKELGQYELALQDWAKAIELNPQDLFAYYHRGLTYYDLMQYEQAIQNLSKYIDFNPQDPDGYYYHALANHDFGKTAEAEEDLTKYMELKNRAP